MVEYRPVGADDVDAFGRVLDDAFGACPEPGPDPQAGPGPVGDRCAPSGARSSLATRLVAR